MEYIQVKQSIFKGKQNIPWGDVEKYLKVYVGKVIAVKESGEEIIRYDSFFAVRIYEQGIEEFRLNYYKATLVVRINDTGKYLYDVINIKKEARKPMDH